jgi:hypothetical protein
MRPVSLAREPGKGVRIDDRGSKVHLTNSLMGLFDLFPEFYLMDSFPQEANARHPRNGISIDPYLAAINLFDILPGHDFFRGAHFIDLPILEKNEAITIFRSEV